MGDGKRLAVLEEKSNDSFIELKNYYYVAFFRPQNFHLIHASLLFEVFLRLINLSLHR